MSEYKCSNFDECQTLIDGDDWSDNYGMCAECYGKFAPERIRELEAANIELQADYDKLRVEHSQLCRVYEAVQVQAFNGGK